LLKHGSDVNAEGGGGKMRDNPHGTPLQAASSDGHHQIVQLLLDSEADVNVPGRDYGTALQAASHGGHDQIVQRLVKHGADVNAQGDKEHAKRSSSQEFGNFKRNGKALQAASAEGWYKTVQLLLNSGADINTQTKDYETALQAASREGHD
jgi:ankyrin repeat protein